MCGVCVCVVCVCVCVCVCMCVCVSVCLLVCVSPGVIGSALGLLGLVSVYCTNYRCDYIASLRTDRS